MSNCSASCTSVRSPLIAAIATFALKADVWFRRGLLLMLSPDSRAKSCPLSGRSSTYRPVQILEAGSTRLLQTSTPIQPGNSGGPLLDSSSRVVGVIVAQFNALPNQNVNFAIQSPI